MLHICDALIWGCVTYRPARPRQPPKHAKIFLLVQKAERRTMEELLKFLGFTTPLIYAGAAYGLFHWLDENASDEAKAALARTMLFKDYKNEQVASALVEVFDRIYTYPLLRRRAFFRCCYSRP